MKVRWCIDSVPLSIDPCACSSIFLHGRQVPRLLHHHNRLLARSDRCHLCRLLDGSLPTHRWQGQAHRGLLVPTEVNDSKNFLYHVSKQADSFDFKQTMN
jgi:hypothetical protein